MNVRIAAVSIAFLLLPAVAFAQAAQAAPYGVLEYYGDDLELTVYDDDNFEVNFFLGMDLSPGDRIVTENTTVEIRLEPNGTIMKIGENTSITLDSIQGRDDALESSASIGNGRLRMVAARLAGAEYNVRLPGAVAGVRGTDFIAEVVEGESRAITVLEGEVEFAKNETGESVGLLAGQRADAAAESFEATTLSPEQLQQLSEGFAFEALDPDQVPSGEEEAQPSPDADAPAESDEESQEETETTGTEEDTRFLSGLGDVLGFQVGSITIDRDTYAEAVFQPAFEIGKLRLAFYLPIVYQDDLLDPWEWYRPDGNNEWSFGSDKEWRDEPDEAAADFAQDAVMKIRYIEYGEQRDPFFLKVGNISSVTLGHGLLMYKYANDLDFPAVRRVGLNVGVDREGWGFEGVINDIPEPAVYGGRLYFRPARPLSNAAVGLSAITDVSPTGELPETDEAGNPLPLNEVARRSDLLFLNVAMDLDVPIIERDIFSLVAFGDIGGMIPYVRKKAGGVGTGIKFDALVDLESSELKNYGIASGFLGNITLLDYRLEFRRYDGTFRHGFFGPNYDRLRGSYAVETLVYLDNPEADRFDLTTMGIYGEAGADIFQLLRLEAGYFWPWEEIGGDWQPSDRDEFNLSATIREGLLPLGISASLGYRRTFFVPTLLGDSDFKKASLFDENTVASASVTYPFAENIDITASVYSTINRDSAGNIVYEKNGTPKVSPTVAIQTRVGF